MEPFVKQLLALLGVLLFAGTVAALTVSGAVADVDFYQKPFLYQFDVVNESAQSYPFDVQIIAPIEINRVQQPSILNAHSTNHVVLQLIPNDELLGQEVAATLVVRYGSQETRKELTLTFEKAEPTQNDSGNTPNPIAGLVALAFSPAVWELIVDAVLLVIVVVLIVALIARISKRVKK